MKSQNDLAGTKLCPFCGSQDIKLETFDPYDGYQGDCSRWIIECVECGAKVERKEKEEALSAWNRRSIWETEDDGAADKNASD